MQTAVVGTAAIGMTVVIISAGIDPVRRLDSSA